MRIATILCLPILATLTLACEDPAVAQRKDAEKKLAEASAGIVRAAQQAGVDRVAAAEDLRSAAARAQGISGATAAQQETASALVATARTQAALLELGRLNQIESANRANRSLALGLLRAADAMHSHVSAHHKQLVTPAIGEFAPLSAAAQGASRDLAESQRELESQISALKEANGSAMAEAESRLAEAEETRQRGLQAGPGEITLIAEEAGRQRDGARELQTRAASGEVDLVERESSLRLHSSDAESARRHAESIARAIAALEALADQYDAASIEGGAVISNLRETITSLVTMTDPSKNEGWTSGVERLAGDLDAAESAAGQVPGAAKTNVAVARARALLAQSEATFQHALLLHYLASGETLSSTAAALDSEAGRLLSKAREQATAAIDGYTAVKEALSASAEPKAEVVALALTIDRAIAMIGSPSFDVRERAAAPSKVTSASEPTDTAATEPEAGDSGDVPLPPFGSAQDLAAFLTRSGSAPEALVRIDGAFFAKGPDGQAMEAMTVGLAKGMAALQLAMKAKFGSASLGPAMDQMAAQASGTAEVSDATDSEATITFATPMSSISYKAVKTDDGWKVDLDATTEAMPEAERSQLTAATAMMAPLAGVFADLAAKVESGELKSAQEVQFAMMRGMQGAMAPGGG